MRAAARVAAAHPDAGEERVNVKCFSDVARLLYLRALGGLHLDVDIGLGDIELCSSLRHHDPRGQVPLFGALGRDTESAPEVAESLHAAREARRRGILDRDRTRHLAERALLGARAYNAVIATRPGTEHLDLALRALLDQAAGSGRDLPSGMSVQRVLLCGRLETERGRESTGDRAAEEAPEAALRLSIPSYFTRLDQLTSESDRAPVVQEGAVRRETGADVHRPGANPGDELAPACRSIVFYIVAHQDDWQLFGGERAFADLQVGDRKVVFVHTTAGDAGETTGLWEARELAAIASARAAIEPSPHTLRVAPRGGHPVTRYQCSRASLYFLRLPDGSPQGTGYEATGEQSLSRLRDSGAPITAVDGSTTYGSWRDLVDTLASIVAHEREGLEQAPFCVHAADPSEATNPGDHADHVATSEAVRELARWSWAVGGDSLFAAEKAPSPPVSEESLADADGGRHGLFWWRT